jgi:hypothetical protein
MLQQNKIHPRLAFENCGLFIDAERAYAMSKEYEEEQAKKAVEMFGNGENADDKADTADKNNDVEQ